MTVRNRKDSLTFTMSQDALKAVLADFGKCYELANRMDALDPEAPGAFTGTVSERLVRAFTRLRAKLDQMIEARDSLIEFVGKAKAAVVLKTARRR